MGSYTKTSKSILPGELLSPSPRKPDTVLLNLSDMLGSVSTQHTNVPV